MTIEARSFRIGLVINERQNAGREKFKFLCVLLRVQNELIMREKLDPE